MKKIILLTILTITSNANIGNAMACSEYKMKMLESSYMVQVEKDYGTDSGVRWSLKNGLKNVYMAKIMCKDEKSKREIGMYEGAFVGMLNKR